MYSGYKKNNIRAFMLDNFNISSTIAPPEWIYSSNYRNLIKKISTNKAIVISTHILEEVEAVCSRTVIIANGQLLANETPDNLGKQFNKKNMFSLKVANKLNNTQIKDIKSSLDYKKVTVKNLNITDTLILIEDEKENINLNKIMTQLKKHKLDINEAAFIKPSLDDIFRKITQ